MEATDQSLSQLTHPLPNAYDHDSPLNGIVRYELENINFVTLTHYYRIKNHHQMLEAQKTDEAQTSLLMKQASNLSGSSPSSQRIHSNAKKDTHPFKHPSPAHSFNFITQPPLGVLHAPRQAVPSFNNDNSIMPFTLKSARKLDGTTEVKLLTKGRLDREFMEKYNLRLVAHDRGGKSGFMDVVVTILDANDHKPVFERPSYNHSISEKAPIGTPLLSFSASDLDVGDNALVSYHFSSQTKLQYESLAETFSLDPFTGKLKLVGQLDYETTPVYGLVERIINLCNVISLKKKPFFVLRLKIKIQFILSYSCITININNNNFFE